METHFPLTLGAAFAVAFFSGAMNSVAGGGTLLSFPILIALGLPPILANATTTAGLLAGSMGSIWGFKTELYKVKKRFFWLLLPSLLGGGLGAWLLCMTPAKAFEPLVPFLLLFATLLFVLREMLQKTFGVVMPLRIKRWWLVFALLAQFLVSVYGGYFGAGMSIILLSLLWLWGMKDLLQMNALTSLFAFCINGLATAVFIGARLIVWPVALAMACGAALGGYCATRVAYRVGRHTMSKLIISIGLVLSMIAFARWLFG